jgi:hypothetical protein
MAGPRSRTAPFYRQEKRDPKNSLRIRPARFGLPRSPEDLFPLLGGTGQGAHGTNEGRDLTPAGDRLGGVAATLRRSRRRAFGGDHQLLQNFLELRIRVHWLRQFANDVALPLDGDLTIA